MLPSPTDSYETLRVQATTSRTVEACSGRARPSRCKIKSQGFASLPIFPIDYCLHLVSLQVWVSVQKDFYRYAGSMIIKKNLHRYSCSDKADSTTHNLGIHAQNTFEFFWNHRINLTSGFNQNYRPLTSSEPVLPSKLSPACGMETSSTAGPRSPCAKRTSSPPSGYSLRNG